MASINYKGRNLRENKSCETPRSLVFFDCETTPVKVKDKENKHKLHLLLGVAKFIRLENGTETRAKKIVFKTAVTFWDWLESVANRHRLTLCFAHNAIFDLCCLNLTEAEQNWGWKLAAPYQARQKGGESKTPVNDNPLVALDCPPLIICLQNESTKARVIFLDTLNYFNCSLEKLGETIGLPKLPICFDSYEWQEMADYCERDVDIIKKAVVELMEWQKSLQLGNFRYTLPANAFNAFRHRFMRHDIVIHDHVKVKQLERAAYYGGQTEVYSSEKHDEPVYLLDVRSLYPSVMRFNQFPTRLLDYQESQTGEIEWKAKRLENCVASVSLSTSSYTFPMKQCGKTEYRSGVVITTLAGPELFFADSIGSITACSAIAEYECHPIFTEFVDFFWTQRQHYLLENNSTWAELCKLFLNSISGKFAQLTAAWNWVDNCLSDNPWKQWLQASLTTGKIDHFRAIGNRVQIRDERTGHPNSFCAISAFVTSYGRERMRSLRGIAGKNNVYYQGVDSLVINQPGLHTLLGANEIARDTLGRLRIVETAESFHARGKMDYNFGNRRIVAGLKQNAIEVAADEFTQTIFSGVETLFEPDGEKQISTEEFRFHRQPSRQFQQQQSS